MKFKNLLFGTVLFVTATVANATTVFEATDGDINFIFESAGLSTYTLAIFDDETDFGGTNLEVVVPELVAWDGVDTLSGSMGSLTISNSSFVLGVCANAVDCSIGGNWTGGNAINSNSPVNTYLVGFSGNGIEIVVDVNPVPVPAAVWLFGSGLIGLVAVGRRKLS